MKENPVVSVVMAAYNAEKHIKASIESILNQTYKNFELIIVDDCSKDNTLKIIKEYAAKDKRIKLIQNETNLKVSETRNKAIDAALGKYIAINDSDDNSLPERFAKQVDFLEKHQKFDFLGTCVECFYDESCSKENKPHSTIKNLEQYHFNYAGAGEDYEAKAREIKRGFAETMRLCHSSIMGKAILFKRLKYRKLFAEDSDLFTRAIIDGYKITKLSDVLLQYRIVNSGLSGSFNKKEHKQCMKEISELQNAMLKYALLHCNLIFALKFIWIRYFKTINNTRFTKLLPFRIVIADNRKKFYCFNHKFLSIRLPSKNKKL